MPKQHVETLIERAAKADDSADAMRLAQAATNAANALMTLSLMAQHPKPEPA